MHSCLDRAARIYLIAQIISATVVTGMAHLTQIIAHRGSSYTAPENTVASVRLAWDQNADAIECDIHLSKDGKIVVIHDADTARTARVSLRVSETTSEELRKLDVGSPKDPKYAGEKIPFLHELMETVPAGKQILIEIKCGKEVLPALKDTLTSSGKMAQVVIVGFGLDTIVAAKQMMPVLPVWWLRSTATDKSTNTKLPHDLAWIDIVKASGLDGLSVDHAGCTPEFAKAIKAAGQRLSVWTIDDPAEARRFRDMGMDVISTNRPDLIRKAFEEGPAQSLALCP